MGEYFGTDGIRGVANAELTSKMAYTVGRAAAHVLKFGDADTIIIGRDTRRSGDMILAALTSGILSVGLNVIDLGIIPTPGVAYLSRYYEAAAGIVISASHNPGEFNGIKLFSSEGYKLSDEIEAEIEYYISHPEELNDMPIGENIGIIRKANDPIRIYIDYLKTKADIRLDGLKIAMDCGHGAALSVAPILFKELGADVIAINTDYDGMNINKNCGSTNPGMVRDLVLSTGADIGLAFDGDADRLIAVDEKGRVMNGDHYLAAVAKSMMNRGTLAKNTIVGTVMANLGLVEFCKANGIELLMTDVGDRYVLEKMTACEYNLGGEQSGHFIFLDDNTTGDGALSALMLIETMLHEKKKLSELNEYMVTYPQVLRGAKVSNESKHRYLEDTVIVEEIKKLELRFNGSGRVLIRPSGTEPLVRVMVEGIDQKELVIEAEKLVALIEKRLN